jgi:hypothetical protein
MPLEKETAKKYGISDISKYTTGNDVDLDKINKDLSTATPFERQHIQSLAKNYLSKKVARKTIKDISVAMKESVPEEMIKDKELNDAFASDPENWKKAFTDLDAAGKLSKAVINGVINNSGNIVVSILNRPAFGPFMQLLGANRAYEPPALAVIAFAITWGCMGLIQLVTRFSKHERAKA